MQHTIFKISKRQLFMLAVAFCFLHGRAIAQTPKGSVLIAVQPENAIIRIDTMLVEQQRTHIPIDTGRHIIRAWAPGRMLLTDTLHITDSRAVLYRRKLPATPQYRKYKNQLFTYKTSRFTMRYLPAILTVGAAGYYIAAYQKYDADAGEYLEKANDYKSSYENHMDADSIQILKDLFYFYKEKYDNAIDRTNSISKNSIIVVSAGIVTTGIVYYLSRKLVRPVFEEKPLLSGLSFDYNISGRASGPRINYKLRF